MAETVEQKIARVQAQHRKRRGDLGLGVTHVSRNRDEQRAIDHNRAADLAIIEKVRQEMREKAIEAVVREQLEPEAAQATEQRQTPLEKATSAAKVYAQANPMKTKPEPVGENTEELNK